MESDCKDIKVSDFLSAVAKLFLALLRLLSSPFSTLLMSAYSRGILMKRFSFVFLFSFRFFVSHAKRSKFGGAFNKAVGEVLSLKNEFFSLNHSIVDANSFFSSWMKLTLRWNGGFGRFLWKIYKNNEFVISLKDSACWLTQTRCNCLM